MDEKVGIFVDSFPILHNGHQLCMKYAANETDRLILLIYDNPSEDIPLPVRVNWLKKLYPNYEIIVTWNNLENSENGKLTKGQQQFFDKVLRAKGITNFYSTRDELEHISQELNCSNRIKKQIRERVARATERIAQDPYKYKYYMNPEVYSDLIVKVAFVGAQSTGKTTLSQAMAKKYNTEWMYEYGRYYAEIYQDENNQSPLPVVEEITRRQLKLEDELTQRANRYLFVDTCPIVTLRYAYDWYGVATDSLIKWANEASSRYDLFFLCGTDIPYEDTPERDGEEQRNIFQSQIKSELVTRGIPFIELRGTLQERMERIENVLDGFKKYSSLGENVGIANKTKEIEER